MCKPKSQGGQRCLTHIKQQQQSFAERIARKQELAANNHLPPSRRTKAQRELEALQEKHEAVSEELMAAEKRAAEREAARDTQQQKKTPKASAVATGELQRHQRLSLTVKELELVKEDAAKKGIAVNALFRERFSTRWDNLRAASAGELPHQVSESETVGRKPMSQRGGITQATSIGLTHETLRSIEAESKAFKLTPSAYIRRIMLQQDPRQRGADTSKLRADDDRATLAFTEQRQGITAESSTEEIAEAWKSYIAK